MSRRTVRADQRNRGSATALVLQITPVPKPLFNINLRSTLKHSEWAALRRSVIMERGRKCGTCSKAVKNSSDLQAHEECAYDTSGDPAVARIRQIVIQCSMCHGCEHFFRLLSLAKRGIVASWQITDLIEHFCEVNGVGPKEFDEHAFSTWEEWKRLSALRWRLDLRPYSEALVHADPVTDINGLNSGSERPWADPTDSKRQAEFLFLLTEISTRYGYWIGSTPKSQKPPLHLLEPGTPTGEYAINRTMSVTPDGVSTLHSLSWSHDPQKGSKRRRTEVAKKPPKKDLPAVRKPL
jgi:hypothetical protein